MAKKPKSQQKERLFEEKLVPAKPGSGRIFDVSYGDDEPVECLGITFKNEEARREHFLAQLREKLQDPEFRKIEGFPVGEDDDILALSDPPYYTACPNPFLEQAAFHAKHNTRKRVSVFADDVSGSKHGKLYNVHPYHTKVPPEAILPLIQHYTEPGDVILDPFAGTGMTGVAVDMCNKAERGEVPRSAVLCDLSAIASFIGATYTSPSLSKIPLVEVWDQALAVVDDRTRQLFRTKHTGWRANESKESKAKNRTTSKEEGTISYVVWADVYRCPNCGVELNYWDAAVELFDCVVQDVFKCVKCRTLLCKEPKFEKVHSAHLVERATETWYDPLLSDSVLRQKRSPALISYDFGGTRYEKFPDDDDLATIAQSDRLRSRLTTQPMMFVGEQWGDTWRAGVHTGITHWHRFFTNRVLHVMPQHRDNRSREVVGPLSGTLYVPSIGLEVNPLPYLLRKRTAMLDVWRNQSKPWCFVTTQSSSHLKSLPDESIDYVFADPPFGDNLFYSELNFPWESVLRCHTTQGPEVIVSPAEHKNLGDYTHMMTASLRECFRVLKPGRWLTIEFHNSKNAVWTAIHEAIEAAGFVVADVRTLDKKKGTTKQLTFANAVKQDLIISSYKPNDGFEERFGLEQGTEEGVWDFLRTHLRQLPVFVAKDNRAEIISERQKYLLFDRMVAFHVQRGVTVPVSAAEFYAGLIERFPERDGMFFLADQVPEFDKKRVAVKDFIQMELFVSDETTAIQWLKQQLSKKPQTRQELHPNFLKDISGWQKYEKQLELSELLDQNFLCYDGAGEIPSQIHSYLSTNFHELRSLAKDDPTLIAKAKNRWYVPDHRKEADLEKVRHRALMKEFEEYRQAKSKLKVVRTEALRAGFKECWQNSDYQTIVDLAKRVKDEIIQEDPALLMYYDNALMRTEG